MSEFEYQRYIPFVEFQANGSFNQKLDARSILLITCGLLISAIILRDPVRLLILLGITLTLLIFGKQSIPGILRSSLPGFPLLLLVALINVIWNSGRDTGIQLYRASWITLSVEDVIIGVLLILRFLIIIFTINLASGSIPTNGLINGLERLLRPLTWVGIRSGDLVISIQIAIRFIPILGRTAERIAKAQASRGAEWGTGGINLFARVRQVIPLLIPLFVSSLQRADTLALAMDARGYAQSTQRTAYTHSTFTALDGIVLAVIGTAIGLLLLYP